MNFDAPPSAKSLEAMKREVESLITPAGIRINWRDLQEADRGESFNDLFVLRFTGRCESPVPVLFSELGPYGEATMLGEARTVNQEIQPFGQVACDSLRSLLTPAVRTSKDKEQIMGRAMGRVVAHELFHMMTKTSKHSSNGVFQASHKTPDLLKDSFAFAESDRETLRKSAQRMVGAAK